MNGRLKCVILVLSVAALSLAFSACGDGDGNGNGNGTATATGNGESSIRLVLEADFSELPAEFDHGAIMTILGDVLERRAIEFGVDDVRVESEDSGRVSVTLKGGISADEARQLLEQKGRLEFRQPTLDQEGRVLCQTPEGAQFSVAPDDITYVPEAPEDPVLPRCVNSEGQSGTIVWTPVDTSDGQGQDGDGPQLPILPLGATVDRSGPPMVIVTFFPEAGILFEKVTAGLVGLPLGIFVDGELLAGPTVEEPVTDSRVVIAGLSLPRAIILAAQLTAGELPVPVSDISDEGTAE